MVSAIISRVVILVFGLLYPAYNSYKAVKTKNVKEYVKWMMYWIVFAFFTCVETFADIFLSWVPFYYELKILFVLWLLSPATKGSSYLYRKFIHPQLSKKEKEIDTYINKASDEGYTALLSLGSKGINYATNVMVKTAITGQSKVVEHLKKSYSVGDLSKDDNRRVYQEEQIDEDEPDNRIIEESYREEMGREDSPGFEEDVRGRQRRSVAGDLHTVQEGEEPDNGGSRSRGQRKSAQYNTKEAYHYGTLPRSTRSKTSAARTSVKNVKY